MEDSSSDFQCVKKLTEGTDCTKVPALDAATFVSGFAVLKSPEKLFNSTGIEDLSADDVKKLIVEPKIYLCQEKEDGTLPCKLFWFC